MAPTLWGEVGAGKAAGVRGGGDGPAAFVNAEGLHIQAINSANEKAFQEIVKREVGIGLGGLIKKR
jgi:hypothetical protein